MYHLTLEGIVHKDLAARNVLITKDFRGKISDFGLARKYEEDADIHYTQATTG